MSGSFSKSYSIGGDFLKLEPKNDLDLSIELSLDGFSFLVSDQGKPIVIEEYLVSGSLGEVEYSIGLAELLKELDLSKFSFNKVKVLIQTANLVIVPKSLFDTNISESIYGFCVPDSNSNPKQIDQLEVIDCVGIFELPQEIDAVLKQHFQHFEIHHWAASLISWFLKSSFSNSSQQQVVVQPFKSGFSIFCFENKNLLAYNSFKCVEDGDFIYYLIYFLEQFDLDFSQLNILLLLEKGRNYTFADSIHQIFSEVLEVESHLHLVNH